MIVTNILSELIAHKAQITAGIEVVEKAKQEAGWLKVARGAISTAIENLKSHSEVHPQEETPAAAPTPAPAPETTPAATAPETKSADVAPVA